MTTLIHERVEMARRGTNPYVFAKMRSGWAVMGDVQPLPGYCLLLPDPVVPSINDMSTEERALFSDDMWRIGDALLACTDAFRINYEILGNGEPALHAHILPRYSWESDDKRVQPAFASYDWSASPPFDPEDDRELVRRLAGHLSARDAPQ